MVEKAQAKLKHGWEGYGLTVSATPGVTVSG